MIQLIKDLYNAWRYKRAVKKAVKLQKLTGRKQLVVVVNGKLVVAAKQDIKKMVATHQFRKGVKVQDIETNNYDILNPKSNEVLVINSTRQSATAETEAAAE